MPRDNFDDQLKRLQDELLAMGELVDQELSQAVQASVQHDHARPPLLEC